MKHLGEFGPDSGRPETAFDLPVLVQTEPLDLNMIPMLFGQLSVSSSPVGSPATIARMLEFCGTHNINAVTEHFPMSKVNEALAHLHEGKARYRIVLDRE